MAKHECPDCGASHEMSTAGRIEKLEERVRELEAKQHGCPHGHYYWWSTPSIYPTWQTGGTWQPDTTTTISYDSNTISQITS